MKGNCLIAQSGGPTSVINNSLVGVIQEALNSTSIEKTYGAVNGIYGLLNNQYISFNQLSAQKLEALKNTPGAALGSWRYKVSAQEIEQILSHMKQNDIRYFFYIGGNGSMQVAKMIAEQAKEEGYALTVIGVPKSIDNDLMGTDHSPGFGSAAKFLATCILDLAMDVKSFANSQRVTIVETMGRNTGWLAGACALAREVNPNVPNLIYIPESAFSIEEFLEDVKREYSRHGFCIAVVSEGIRDADGQLVAEQSRKMDALGRPRLGGVSSYLVQEIEDRTNLLARYILPSIWQRSGMAFSSKIDVEEAFLVGKEAFKLAEKGLSGVMVSIERKQQQEYGVNFGYIPLEKMASKEKHVPLEWYNSEKRMMTNEFINYVQPLIQGEVLIPTSNGLPSYIDVV